MNQHYKLRLTRLLSALSLLLVFATSAVAQVSSTYSFTSTLGTYTPITGGTVLSGTLTDDDVNYPIQPIGFNFNYNGQVFTTVGVQSNGHITLGALATNTYPVSILGFNN
jgi:hypothetical protein